MTSAKVVMEEETLHGARLSRIRFAAPDRCNALEPAILTQLRDALHTCRSACSDFVALTAEGRHFSTGGDVAAFQASTDRAGYADAVVGLLQGIVREMLTLPAIIVTGAQGATTGGSAGLLFASDFVVLTEDAFIQPYYAQVGFAPDGGWAALLPERIGPGRALRMQLENSRLSAAQALELGLAARKVPGYDLDAAVDRILTSLAENHSVAAMKAAKRLVWDERRIAAVAERLDAEHAAFRDLIVREDTADGMERFLNAL